MKKEKGQVIIILLLVILVVLAIGVAIVQKSLSDVSTSSKIEHSSRAFSAAEAGLESAFLLPEGTPTTINLGELGNQSNATVKISYSQPDLAGQALEYPPLTKADFAHFWLKSLDDDPLKDYNKLSFRVWFGSCEDPPCFDGSDQSEIKPAVEVSLIKKLADGTYVYYKSYLDSDPVRSNSFTKVQGAVGMCSSLGVEGLTTESATSLFYCRADVSGYTLGPGESLVLVRVRVLYSNEAQKVALGPSVSSDFLPPQAALFVSEGKSGEVIRRLRVLRVKDVVPPFFDFAIFSIGPIKK